MRVTLLQTDIAWQAPQQNIAAAERLIDSCQPADLYVLPEMWSTGFAIQPEGVALEESSDAALAWMRREAASRRVAISGSLAIKAADGSFRNRHYFIDGRNGSEHFYDKHHLFTNGGEHHSYTAGNSHTTLCYEGWRILLLTCYDLRFPLWSRYADERTYDIILLAANWPRSRQQAWQVLTRARAIENQAYVVAANRVGSGGGTHYVGGSCIVDPRGTLLALGGDCEQTLSATLSADDIKEYRNRFAVLNDRDIR